MSDQQPLLSGGAESMPPVSKPRQSTHARSFSEGYVPRTITITTEVLHGAFVLHLLCYTLPSSFHTLLWLFSSTTVVHDYDRITCAQL